MDDLGGYGPIIIVTLWTETAIALVFVCMRLYTRLQINRVVGWDDFLIALSCLMLIPYATAVTLACLKGLGRHSNQLSLSSIIYTVRAEVIGQTFGIVGLAISKASVAAFLLRITIITWHKWVLYITIFSVSAICFITALFDFIRCDPIESIWNVTIVGKCWMSADGYTTLSLIAGVISATADFVLAILPWFILWNLQMKRKEKNLIAASMSLGLFAGVCGVIRTLSVKRVSEGTDYSYETVSLILWNSTELTVTILCATIPTLRPLLSQLLRFCCGTRPNTRRQSYKLSSTAAESKIFQGPSTVNTTSVVAQPHSHSQPQQPKHPHYQQDIESQGRREVEADVRSDKSILGHRGGTSDGSIVCTDVVYVEYEDRSEPYTPSFNNFSAKRSAQNWEMI